jgi:hypothetical protein
MKKLFALLSSILCVVLFAGSIAVALPLPVAETSEDGYETLLLREVQCPDCGKMTLDDTVTASVWADGRDYRLCTHKLYGTDTWRLRVDTHTLTCASCGYSDSYKPAAYYDYYACYGYDAD